jgi:hypothetical protein
MRDQSPLPERRQVMTEVQFSCLVISFLCERFSGDFAHRHRPCGTALRLGSDRWVAVGGPTPSHRSQKSAGQDPAASGFGH